jgi:outer membrane PBP1 activator LpoA protein
MLRGDRETYAATMALLLSQPLPAQLAQEVLRHQLEVAQLAEDAPRELDLCLRLLRAAGPQAPEQEQEQEQEPYRVQIETGLWRALQRLDGEQAQSLRLRGDRELTGWLDLAASAAVPMPGNAVAALTAWTAEYPDHPAALRAASLRDAAINDARTTQLSLLLPLTGPLANASEAVTEGFLAAFYADNSSAISVDVIDSSRFADVGEAYARAQENGASVIVGPLGKREVESLLQRDTMTTPLLTLNRPESGLPVKPGALLLSLAPEDEVEQLAESAWDSGGRRVLLIRPEGSWGTRMEYALRERWTELGGRIPATAVYGKAGSYSDALSAALGLDASTQRSSRVRAVFNERVETLGRRRDDIDTILLLSRTSEEARALKPLINYYYAGDLPVYALSTADSGSSTRNVNRDLSGLQLLAMPWRVSEQGVPGLESADGSSLAALHAMGADAYALARRWWRMRSPAAPTFRGLTATLDAQTDGVLARRLNLAEYQQGALLPR